MKTLIIHVPLSWDRLHRAFFKSFVEMTAPEVLKEVEDRFRLRVKYLIDESFPIDFNRNKACQRVLGSGAEWLLCLDSDMVFPRLTLPMLLEAATPEFSVVTGNYHKKASPHQSVAGWYIPNADVSRETLAKLTEWGFVAPSGQQTLLHRPCSEFGRSVPFPVDTSGGGCLLIHHGVLQVIGQPYFKYFDQFRDGHCPGLENVTEDMWFFSQCKKAGIAVRLDPRIQCGHLGEKEFTWMDQDLSGQAFIAPGKVP